MNGINLKKLSAFSAQRAVPDLSQFFLSQTALLSQPSTSFSKGTEHDFLGEVFDFDMGDIDAGFVDSLGDANMDSYTDLHGILSSENTITGQPQVKEQEDELPLTLLDFDAQMKSQQYFFKHPSEEMEDPSADLGKLSASVGLKRSRTPSLDHDYTIKCPKLSVSPSNVPATVETTEEFFLVPDLSPASSPSPSSPSSKVSSEVKKRQRREKNNLASKRSREIRKRKFLDMETEAERLSEENVQLEQRVAELEKLAHRMKETLVAKLKIK